MPLHNRIGLNMGGLQNRERPLAGYCAATLIYVGYENSKQSLAQSRKNNLRFTISPRFDGSERCCAWLKAGWQLLLNSFAYRGPQLSSDTGLGLIAFPLNGIEFEIIGTRNPGILRPEEWFGEHDAPDVWIFIRKDRDTPVEGDPLPHLC